MTTVFYDGKMLAADSRTTTGNTEHNCHACGEETFQHRDNTNKIAIGKDAKWREENILAVACSGGAEFNRGIRTTIGKGDDLEKAWEIYNRFRPNNAVWSTAIIVTDKSVWKVSFVGTTIKAKKFGRDKVIGTGSGYKSAKTAHMLTGLDAVESVIIATTADKYTGGSISYVDFSRPELKVEKSEKYSAKEAIDNIRTFVQTKRKSIKEKK